MEAGQPRTQEEATEEEEEVMSGSGPAELEAGLGTEVGASALLSERKSSMEGLSRGRLSCCSRVNWRMKHSKDSSQSREEG